MIFDAAVFWETPLPMSSVDHAKAWLGASRQVRRRALMVASALAGALSVHATDGDFDGSAWDRARAQLIAQGQGPMAQAVEQWKLLSNNDQWGPPRFGFAAYARFVTNYPGFPEEERLRRAGEAALERETATPAELIAFFDRYPPLGNPARARYALALGDMGRVEAAAVARAAWRGGVMSDAAEAAILAHWGTSLTTADHDARIDALLWAGAAEPARRILPWTSPQVRAIAAGRLAAIAGGDPYAAAALPAAVLDADPGFVYARARALHRMGRSGAEAFYLAGRPPLEARPLDRARWIEEQLYAARAAAGLGDRASAARIARGAADAFGADEDISRESYGLRDDYTSLVWLGATSALWHVGDTPGAAVLFQRYAAAARGPGLKAKGYYWAALALARGGRAADAQALFAQAAQHSDQFYGLLARERLGQGTPRYDAGVLPVPSAEERARFAAAPLTAAVREVARSGDWHTTIRFFKDLAERCNTPGEFALAAELAQQVGRRDLGVIVGQAAAARGLGQFRSVAFPLIPVPAERAADWTMIHAISRQESQFAANAVSHAGARGLMQMMPRTASEQAGRIGLAYSDGALIADPQFNMAVGSAYFDHLLRVFGGSYPLAVAAYNAGGGNVGKWLRANGDPRTGQVSWIDWIEHIPIAETRAYVEHVLENAVVYEAMNPGRARYAGANPLSHLLGKPDVG